MLFERAAALLMMPPSKLIIMLIGLILGVLLNGQFSCAALRCYYSLSSIPKIDIKIRLPVW